MSASKEKEFTISHFVDSAELTPELESDGFVQIYRSLREVERKFLAQAAKKNAEVEAQIAQVNMRAQQIESEKEQINHNLNDAIEKVNALKIELCQTSAAKKRLQEKLKDRTVAHKQTFSAVEKENTRLKKELSLSNDELARLRLETKNQQNTIADLKKKNALLADLTTKTRKDIESSSNDLVRVKNEKEVLSKYCAQLKNSLKDHELIHARLETEKNHLAVALKKSQEAVQAAHIVINSLRHETGTRLSQYKTQIELLSQKIVLLRSQIASRDKSDDAIKAQIQQLEAKLQEAQTAQEELSKSR